MPPADAINGVPTVETEPISCFETAFSAHHVFRGIPPLRQPAAASFPHLVRGAGSGARAIPFHEGEPRNETQPCLAPVRGRGARRAERGSQIPLVSVKIPFLVALCDSENNERSFAPLSLTAFRCVVILSEAKDLLHSNGVWRYRMTKSLRLFLASYSALSASAARASHSSRLCTVPVAKPREISRK